MQSGHFKETGVEFTIGPLTVDHDLEAKVPGANDGSRERQHYATSLSGSSWRYSGGDSNDQFVLLGGLQIKFHINPQGGGFFPVDSANVGWKMVANAAEYVLTNKSGETYVFGPIPGEPGNSSARRLTSRTSGDGHRILYAYDVSNRVKLVTSNQGYGVVFDYGTGMVTACGYNTSVAQLSTDSTCTAASLKAVYGVTAAGKVSSIRDPSGATITYGYDASSRLNCVSLPNSATCRVTLRYGSANSQESPPRTDQVVRLTTANSEVWTFNFDNVENFPEDYTPHYGEIRISSSNAVGPNGYTSFFEFGNGYLTSVSSSVASETYSYNSNGAWSITYATVKLGPFYYSLYPSSVTRAEGDKVGFTRDLADNVTIRSDIAKPGSGLPNRYSGWAYPQAYRWSEPTICDGPDVLCDKPRSFVDSNGNQTDYTYDAAHGGLLTETAPAVGGIRPQKRYTYVQRSAWIKNGASYVRAQPPIWLLASESACKTSAAAGAGCAAGAADQVTTTYDYGPESGPNNLLLRGVVVDSAGLKLRTCYGYDTFGRKISETLPAAILATCP